MTQPYKLPPRVTVFHHAESRRLQPETLQSHPSDMLADLAFIAAQACGVPAAAIFLRDGAETRVEAEYGWNSPSISGGDLLNPNDFSVIIDAYGDLTTVPDLSLGEQRVHFLTSAPLLDTGGHPFGVLCVAAPNEQALNSSQHNILAALARQASALLELHRQSLTDPLTGLANRQAFDTRLAEEVERSRRYGTLLSLLMLDVDDFKGYNDAFGHPAGDEALRGLAKLLTGSVRVPDLVARYGGEEFAVIVPEVEVLGALFLAERCRQAVETASWPHRKVTLSVGVASLPDRGDGQALIVAADRALYGAKRRGGNRTGRTFNTSLQLGA